MYRIQQLAADVLAEVESGRMLTDSLADAFRGCPSLSSADRGALQDICYGVLRFRARLYYALRKWLPRPLSDAQIERLLLVALYQLLYTRAAEYAIVNEAVRAAAHYARGRFKGLCNAVLRNVLRQRASLLSGIEQDDEAHYNHPRWWIQVVQRVYPDQWSAILDVSNQHPPMVLRVNGRRTTLEASLAALQAADIDAVSVGNGAIWIKRPLNVRDIPGFAEGQLSVQDWGAQQAALRLDLQDGLRVLDACAAPGGKTCHMLERANIDVTALDVSAHRLVRVRENLDRLGLDARLKVGDASQVSAWWDGHLFDRILADVPCSATGVVRRHPDIKWLRSVNEVTQLVRQQADIIDALWSVLASGGKMLYATCSIFPEENGMQLAAFLTRHPDAKCVDQEQLLPSESHDGFYYALLEKQ